MATKQPQRKEKKKQPSKKFGGKQAAPFGSKEREEKK